MSLIRVISKNIIKNFTLILKFVTRNKIQSFILSGIFYLVYRTTPFANKTQAIFKITNENKKIFENLLPLNYSPPLWMPISTIQMVVHELLEKKQINFKREYIISDDGGEYSLDWVVSDPRDFHKEKNKKILLILHGLSGGSQTIYMRDILNGMKKLKDFKICVLHNRGINDTPLKTPKSFHISFTKDVKHVLKVFKARYPENSVYTMGISLGANILAKFFANEYDMGNYVKCFISLSNPFDFHECNKNIQNSFLRHFFRFAMKSFFQMTPILRNIKDYEENYQKIDSYSSHKDMDNGLVTKIHPEFKDADEYYTLSSSKDDIKNLKVRTIFFNAKDDILSPIEKIDLKNFEENEKLFLVLTTQGSHICWFTGFFNIKRWFIGKCIDYITTISQLEREK